jgi:hypothetical protein
MGEEIAYQGSFEITSDEPDANYRWTVKVAKHDSGDPLTGMNLVLKFAEPDSVFLRGVTDASGYAYFEYPGLEVENLDYSVTTEPSHPQVSASSSATRGVREYIVIGIS